MKKTTENITDITSNTIRRINGYLHRVVPIADASGKIINYAIKPIMLEFNVRDILQVSIGAALFAIPVSMSEEAWNLANTLPNLNITLIAGFSIFLISIFVYFHFYKVTLKGYVFDFIKREVGTYFISMLIVAIILTLIQKCP